MKIHEKMSIGRNISIDNIVSSENAIWVLGNDSINDVLIHISNVRGMVADEIIIIPDFGMHIDMRYLTLIEFGEKIYLIPQKGKSLDVYDTNLKKWKSFNLPNCEEYKGQYQIIGPKFATAAIFDNQLFIFPNRYPAIVIFNLETNSFEYLCKPIEELIEEKKRYNVSISKKYILHPHEAVFYSPLTGGVYSFNPQKRVLQTIVNLKEQDEGNWQIEYLEDTYWLLDRSRGEYFICINKKKEYEKYFITQNDIEYSEMTFLHSTTFENKIVLFPGMTDEIYIFCPHNKSIVKKHEWKVDFGGHVGYKYSFLCRHKEWVLTYNWYRNRLDCYSLDENKYEQREIVISESLLTQTEISTLVKMIL